MLGQFKGHRVYTFMTANAEENVHVANSVMARYSELGITSINWWSLGIYN